jgi:hypothetical protein
MMATYCLGVHQQLATNHCHIIWLIWVVRYLGSISQTHHMSFIK